MATLNFTEMGERVSISDQSGALPRVALRERVAGAMIGVCAMLITLAIGGTATLAIEFLLSVGPYGSLVLAKLNLFSPSFRFGLWLLIPSLIIGYSRGFDATLGMFSVVWGTAERSNKTLTLILWAALLLLCKSTELAFKFLNASGA